MAASFFLLGDSLSDAVNVCVRNLGDAHLAIALCRLWEGRTDGPALVRLLKETLGPDAFRRGDRLILSWVLDMLGRADLAMYGVSVGTKVLYFQSFIAVFGN